MNWNIANLANLLKRRGWIILMVMLIAGVSAYTVAAREQKRYSATTVMMVTSVVNDSEGFLVSESVAETYRVLLNTAPFLDRVVMELDLPFGADELESMISTESTSQPNFIEVTVTDTDARRSALIARTISSEFQQFVLERATNMVQLTRQNLIKERAAIEQRIEEIEARLDDIDIEENGDNPALQEEIALLNAEKSQANASVLDMEASMEEVISEILLGTTNIEVIEPATTPEEPSQPRPPLVTVLGVVAGLITGVVIVAVIGMAESETSSDGVSTQA